MSYRNKISVFVANKKHKQMKQTIKNIISLLPAFVLIAAASCTHDTDGLEEVKSSPVATAEVFIDAFTADLQYAAFGGSDVKAFDVDTEVKYKGASSMKITVPDENTFAGGTYYSTFGRDLSGYNCLTFWAKATKRASIDEIGFGVDMEENKYKVSVFDLAVNTKWKKYYIPIPAPAKLQSEKGLFFFGEGPEDGAGYTFWIDELKFENLGTIAHPQPKILNGATEIISLFTGLNFPVTGSETFNLPDGTNRDITLSAAYFDFVSSGENAATVSNDGVVTAHSNGSAVITAKMNGIKAAGSLTVHSVADFVHAPARNPDKVISIFSDAYPNRPVDYFNGYWEWQTTQTSEFNVNGDNILRYTNFNFVGAGFPAVDASSMSHIHFDVYLPAETTGARLKIKLLDFGPNDVDDGGNIDDGIATQTFDLVPGQWNPLEMSIESMRPRDKVRLIAYDNDEGYFSNFYLDNIYFYKEE